MLFGFVVPVEIVVNLLDTAYGLNTIQEVRDLTLQYRSSKRDYAILCRNFNGTWV